MQKSLYIIGYEGAILENFIAALKSARTKILIDVRAIPMSREKSQTAPDCKSITLPPSWAQFQKTFKIQQRKKYCGFADNI